MLIEDIVYERDPSSGEQDRKNNTDGDAHRRPDKRCPGKVRLGDRRIVTKSQHEQVNDVDQRYHRHKYSQNPATKVLIGRVQRGIAGGWKIIRRRGLLLIRVVWLLVWLILIHVGFPRRRRFSGRYLTTVNDHAHPSSCSCSSLIP